MRVLSILFTLLLFLIALGLALSNTQLTELRFFLFGDDAVLRAPLVILLLMFFIVGVAFGMVTGLPSYLRQRSELARMRRQVKRLQDAPSVAEPARQVTPAASGAANAGPSVARDGALAVHARGAGSVPRLQG